MKTIWLVTLYSSGERWHTYVCGSTVAVNRSLGSYGMTREHGNDESEYQDWRNLADISQTATVMRQFLVE